MLKRITESMKYVWCNKIIHLYQCKIYKYFRLIFITLTQKAVRASVSLINKGVKILNKCEQLRFRF